MRSARAMSLTLGSWRRVRCATLLPCALLALLLSGGPADFTVLVGARGPTAASLDFPCAGHGCGCADAVACLRGCCCFPAAPRRTEVAPPLDSLALDAACEGAAETQMIGGRSVALGAASDPAPFARDRGRPHPVRGFPRPPHWAPNLPDKIPI